MINPKLITNFSRTDKELQAFWLFCVCVAGKNSDQTARVIGRLLARIGDKTPFEYLSEMGEVGIHNLLVANRVGQYSRIVKAFVQSLSLDLRECTLEDLLAVYGVGNKTARFFLLHSRPNQKYAGLDTHVLAWLRSVEVEAPAQTPTSPKKYLELEKTFLALRSMHFPLMNDSEADLFIWAKMSNRLEETVDIF